MDSKLRGLSIQNLDRLSEVPPGAGLHCVLQSRGCLEYLYPAKNDPNSSLRKGLIPAVFKGKLPCEKDPKKRRGNPTIVFVWYTCNVCTYMGLSDTRFREFVLPFAV